MENAGKVRTGGDESKTGEFECETRAGKNSIEAAGDYTRNGEVGRLISLHIS